MTCKTWIVATLASVAVLSPAFAQINTFKLATTLTDGSTAAAALVLAADINGDGKVDVVGAGTVYTNNGKGTLTAFSASLLNLRSNAFVVADVNRDGKLDVITLTNPAAFPYTENILVYTNSGPVSTYPYGFKLGLYATITNVGSVKTSSGQILASGTLGNAGDVYGNGRMNLFYYNAYSNSVSLFTNNGSGGFGSNITFGVKMGLPVAADVNRDGLMDFISPGISNNLVYIYTNNGSGSYGSNAALSVKGVVSVLPADVNGDGSVDLICLSYTNNNNQITNTISIWTNNGSGTFGSNVSFTVGYVGAHGQQVNDVKAAKLFGDGQLELTFAAYDQVHSYGYLMVYTNNGAGGFGSNFITASVGLNLIPLSVVVADVSGDGNSDLVSANYSSYYNTLTVFTNTGSGIQSGSFLSNSMPVLFTNNFGVSALDLYRNGKLELVTTPNTTPPSLLVLTNDGSGNFGSNTLISGFGNGYMQSSPIMADIFGNGSPALILGFQYSGAYNKLIILTNNGSGVFGTNSGVNLGSYIVNKVVAADVNGDGKLDLIVSSSYISSSPGYLLVLTNNGSGGFGTNVTLTLPAFTRLAVADVNGDGRPDLIAAYSYSGYSQLTVFTNLSVTGAGLLYSSSATPPSYYNGSTTYSITAGANPSALVAADVNGDGQMDFIIANNNNPGTLSVLTNSGYNNGNNSYRFGLNSSPAVGAYPYALVAADFSGDGKVDLISANWGLTTNSSDVHGPLNWGTLSVLTNNGSGSFTNPATFSIGRGPSTLIAADLNGDGRLDLVTANFTDYNNPSYSPQGYYGYGNTLSILLNTSSFVNTVVLQTAPTTTAITYGQSLGATGLSGGVATNEAGVPVIGTFAYNNTNSLPGVVSTNPVTFTPTAPTDYQPITFNVSVTVNPLPVILNGSRAYDGTVVATNRIFSVSNKLAGDSLTVSAGSATLASAVVGTNGITSFGTLALGGTKAANYTVSGASGSVIITQAVPVVALTSSLNPQFNGASVNFTATLPAYATGTIQFLTNGVNFDVETITSGSASSVATALLPVGSNTITAAYSGDANDQVSATSLSQLTDPFPCPVLLNGTRVYDGTTNAVYAIFSVANKVGADNVTVSAGSVGLASASVGLSGITSFNGLTLSGSNAANYTLSGLSGAVNIMPLPVVLHGLRAYDGTPTAAYSILAVSNNVGGDVVTVSAGSIDFAAANVGTNVITANNSLALGGLNAANYTPLGASGSVIVTQAVNTITITSSQNPSGYGVGVSFTASLPAFATGTIQFLTNNLVFDTEGMVGGTATGVTNAILPSGSNVVATVYSGDLNNQSVTNYLGQIVNPPTFSAPVFVPGGVALSGSFGNPGQTFYILASTNLTQPISQWIPIYTNTFDFSGSYSFTNPLTPDPGVYFILQVP